MKEKGKRRICECIKCEWREIRKKRKEKKRTKERWWEVSYEKKKGKKKKLRKHIDPRKIVIWKEKRRTCSCVRAKWSAWRVWTQRILVRWRNRAAKGGGRERGGGKSKYVHTCMYIYMYVMYNITERIYMNMHMYV